MGIQQTGNAALNAGLQVLSKYCCCKFFVMKDSTLNKMLGIGPGGIDCGCCVDYPKKRKNHKKLYRRLKRKVSKREAQIQICQSKN